MKCNECDFIWDEDLEGRSCPVCADVSHDSTEQYRCTPAQKRAESRGEFIPGRKPSHEESGWYDWDK